MRFVVPQEFEGKELKGYLSAIGVSAKLCAALKREERGIVLGDRRVTVRERLHAGDVLELALEGRDSGSTVVPRPMELEVLFENRDVIVVNKPANMPTHPSHGHFEDTLANGLAHRYTVDGSPFRPHFINRLDRNTTGVVLVARHAIAAAALSRAMARGEIRKRYLALATGRLEKPFIIESGIRRRAESVILREVCPLGEGKYAKTEVRPVAEGEDCTLLCLIPHTGRTHQLRVHLSHAGHPLVGDSLYGCADAALPRHALHASGLTFPSTQGGAPITVSAPVPADIKNRLGACGEEVWRNAQNALEEAT